MKTIHPEKVHAMSRTPSRHPHIGSPVALSTARQGSYVRLRSFDDSRVLICKMRDLGLDYGMTARVHAHTDHGVELRYGSRRAVIGNAASERILVEPCSPAAANDDQRSASLWAQVSRRWA
ncbi:MAG: hypothetical protein HQL36_00825 [Alphaproteobacteria bacterium]|nr:hypothetical protein [Alphaproteobacteria bacterium]MBF0251193.1 hypothetical protein [Alphaproteobacteria bacterium]